MKSLPKAIILHALLLGLSLIVLFVIRGIYQPLYDSGLAYSSLILAITIGIILLYFLSLAPDLHREEGTMSWYLGRGLSMALAGVLLATLLVNLYAYRVNDGYFARRMKWEEQRLDKQNLSSGLTDALLEKEQEYETYHFEEITIFFLGGLSALSGAVGMSFLFCSNSFSRHGQRQQQPGQGSA